MKNDKNGWQVKTVIELNPRPLLLQREGEFKSPSLFKRGT